MRRFILVFLMLAGLQAYGEELVKVVAYNTLNYRTTDQTRDQYFRTVLRYVHPDVLVICEVSNQAAVSQFYDNVLNLTYPGEYSAGVFIDGYDTDRAAFHKSGMFDFVSNTPIQTALRDINEFTFVHVASAETLRVYAVHLKASDTATDRDKRAAEVDNLRMVTNQLPAGKNFMVLGDFNIYGSTEPAYQKLLQDNPTDDGHVVDALTLTGTWNNAAYAQYHTQSPRVRSFGGGATGGMDDRFDMILFSNALNGSGRVSYVPGSLTPIGNDGLHYNDSINRLPNYAVPDSVANAIHYASDHLPIAAVFSFPGEHLPVQLVNFAASPIPSGIVRLQWSTVSEINNYGFEVQRKGVGDTGFSTIPGSFVPGHGTTQTAHHYSYTDLVPPPGTSWYRLRQIDLNGAEAFTGSVRVEVLTTVAGGGIIGEYNLAQNYPNPFNPNTTIQYDLPNAGYVTLKVYDCLGQEVASLTSEEKPAGRHSVQFNAADIATGVYLYRLQAGNFTQSRRLVVVR